MQVQTCQMCHAWLLSTPPISTVLVSIWWSQCSDAKAEPNFRRFESGHASVPRFWTDFCLPNPLSRQSEKCDDENLQRSSTWINPYQEQFLRKQTSDLGKPGGNGHLDGKTANSTDFPSYHCIVLHIISCLSHSTL